MGKKRVINKKQKVSIETQSIKIPPLMEEEGRFFQELVDASNRYTGLLKQEAQYKFIIKKLEDDRKKIQKGEIELPMLMTLIPKLLSYYEKDKKKVLKIFDDQISAYNANIMSLKGQLEHRYENYIESAARNKEFLNIRFKMAKAKNIVPLRDIGEKDEETLFEAEYKDLLVDKDKQCALKTAHKEAIKRNVARKQK